jgi:hypothetical protein
MRSPVRKCRPTTACSDLDHHKMHAPDRSADIEVGDSAPDVRRPVADAGRSVTHPSPHFTGVDPSL